MKRSEKYFKVLFSGTCFIFAILLFFGIGEEPSNRTLLGYILLVLGWILVNNLEINNDK
jgi:uncharacterized membrane protein